MLFNFDEAGHIATTGKTPPLEDEIPGHHPSIEQLHGTRDFAIRTPDIVEKLNAGTRVESFPQAGRL